MRIAVASGKGGTGKTTVAVNLAVTAARAGLDVHLGDCDVEEPNAHLFLRPAFGPPEPVRLPVPVIDPAACRRCGACAGFCAFNALACLPGGTLVFPDLCHGCGGCWRVCPAGALAPGARVLGEVASGPAGRLQVTRGVLRVGETVVPPLVAAVRARAEGSGWTVLDAPPGTTCPVVATLRGVDYVVLVTEPTPFGLHDLALAADLVRGLGLPCGVVVNRAVPGRDLVERHCAREGLPLLARLPFRREVAAGCAEGALAVDLDAEVAAGVRGLLEALRAREAAA